MIVDEEWLPWNMYIMLTRDATSFEGDTMRGTSIGIVGCAVDRGGLMGRGEGLAVKSL